MSETIADRVESILKAKPSPDKTIQEILTTLQNRQARSWSVADKGALFAMLAQVVSPRPKGKA